MQLRTYAELCCAQESRAQQFVELRSLERNKVLRKLLRHPLRDFSRYKYLYTYKKRILLFLKEFIAVAGDRTQIAQTEV